MPEPTAREVQLPVDPRRAHRGLSFIEVLIASAVLGLTSAYVSSFLLSSKRVFKVSRYHYTAVNLAREILEFGAAGRLSHPFRFKYYYGAPHGHPRVYEEPGGCDTGCCFENAYGVLSGSGYGLKEWWCFLIANPHPFKALGDIKAKGLVPPGQDQDSVEIHYSAQAVPGLVYHGKEVMSQTVVIKWREEGAPRKVELANIPLTQVNDSITIKPAEFTWEAGKKEGDL